MIVLTGLSGGLLSKFIGVVTSPLYFGGVCYRKRLGKVRASQDVDKVRASIPLTRCMLLPKGLQSKWGQFYFILLHLL